jgi:Domain of unknown function (DUF6429)
VQHSKICVPMTASGQKRRSGARRVGHVGTSPKADEDPGFGKIISNPADRFLSCHPSIGYNSNHLIQHFRKAVMEIDFDRIDEAVLALLFLGRHDKIRTWKSFDWSATERLHAKGFISDPVRKAKSVAFTEQGLLQSEALFWKLFEKRSV